MFLSLIYNLPSSHISASRSSASAQRKFSVRSEARTTKPSQISYDHAGFPPGFYFGAASAAYQIEGATTEGGRGPCIWDTFCEKFPEKIADRSNGDPGAGSYHYYERDVKLLKDLGVNIYRFSISWSRILPTGKGEPNREGIQYYNRLIDELLIHNIEPLITIFHWDTPEALDGERESFLRPEIVEDFKHFADICFQHFGDRVKYWLTLNEPLTYCIGGYSLGIYAPGRCTPGNQEYICPAGDSLTEPYAVAHNLLNAHAEAVKLYRDKYQATQGGKIGITLVTNWFVPYSNSPQDHEAQKRVLEFNLGWFMDPIKFGDYPFSMKSLVRERLPVFTPEQSEKLKNSYDFVGINYYTSLYAKDKGFQLDYKPSVCSDDSRVDAPQKKNGIAIGYVEDKSWVYVYPRGLKELLLYIKDRYNNPEIFITENGVMETKAGLKLASEENNVRPEELLDTFRSQYQSIHLHELAEALRLGVRLKGYFVWSLLDSFEWNFGYTAKFGLTYVNNGPSKPYTELVRKPKDSSVWYKWFISVAKSPAFVYLPIEVSEEIEKEEEDNVTADQKSPTLTRLTAMN